MDIWKKTFCQLVGLLYPTVINGRENLLSLQEHLEKGSVIFVFNHLSLADVVVLLRPIFWEAEEKFQRVAVPGSKRHFDLKKHFFHALIMRLSVLIGLEVIPVVQHYEREKDLYSPISVFSLDRQLVEKVHQILATNGGILLFAPEGHRSENGKLQPPQKGIEFLLKISEKGKYNIKVMAVGIEPEPGFSRGLNFGRRFKLHFGPALSEPKIKEKAQKLGLSLDWVVMREIAQLLPPQYSS